MTTGPARHLSVFAPAKLNLYLHVRGRREDGYHLLDSLVAFADIGDQIKITPAPVFSFSAQGPYAAAFSAQEKDHGPDSGNIAVRAAWRLARALGRDPSVKITLTKNLPLASGMGGGSADAAAVLWGLLEYWGVAPRAVPDLPALMLSLGADVPVCFACRPVRMEGVGEALNAAPALGEVPIVLLNPGKRCDTASVFRRRGEGFAGAVAMPEDLSTYNRLVDFLRVQDNMLTASATELVPEIALCLSALKAQVGCDLVRMSGSGATCFGLFATEERAQAAAESLLTAHPHWWVRAGMLNRPERY